MPSISRLREIEREITPAPWYLDHQVGSNAIGDVEWPEHLGKDFPPEWDFYLSLDDAEAIVTLRNSLPHLIAIVDAARALSGAWGSDTFVQARHELNTAIQRLEDV